MNIFGHIHVSPVSPAKTLTNMILNQPVCARLLPNGLFKEHSKSPLKMCLKYESNLRKMQMNPEIAACQFAVFGKSQKRISCGLYS